MSTGVSDLSERQQQIFDLIQSDPAMTLQAIADQVGITRERVRQIAVKLKEMDLIGDRNELRLEAIQSERRARILTRERRKKIWRRMMFVAHRIRLRGLAHIDHRGMVRDYHMPGEETICQFEGCTRSVDARGFCPLHYSHLRKTGALWVRRCSRYICKEDGCDMPVYARNMCQAHYGQWQRKHCGESHLPAHNTSGYRGVVRDRSAKAERWVAYLHHSGKKQEYLGSFETKEMAARAYDTAARKLHGDKAKLNFPNENVEVVKEKRQRPERHPSGYQGVYWQGSRKRWVVRITRDNKQIYVGRFTDLEKAARAYDTAARQAGIDTSLNFPDETFEVYPSYGASHKTSQYRGVYRAKNGTWIAEIEVRGKRVALGRFADEKIAAQAYDMAARQHFGDDARVNFPGESVIIDVKLFDLRGQHTPRQSASSSKYRGVQRDKNRWRARIFIDGKNIGLGSYIDEEEAAHAYDAAAIMYYGDRAILNFPKDDTPR